MNFRAKITLQRIVALFLFSVIALQIGAMGSFFTIQLTTTETLAIKYEETDIQQFLDNDLRNVSVILESSSAGMGASLKSPTSITLDKILIRASTLPYDPKEFPTTSKMLHNIFSTPEKIKHYALRHSNLGGTEASLSGIDALLSLAEETNETSEAVGENVVTGEKFAVEDLVAETEYNANTSLLITNLTHQVGYLTNQSVEPAYQDYAEFLYSNDSNDAIAGTDADDKKDHNILISGFINTEESILDILKSNIAVAYSTSSNILTKDDVTVIDYTLHHANMTNYLSQHFIEKAREAVDDYEESLEAKIEAKLFGLKVFTARAAPSAGILSGFTNAIGKVLNFGKAVVSAPLTQIKKVGGVIKKKVTSVASNVQAAGTSALNFGKGILNAAMAKMTEIQKTIGTKIASFGQSIKLGVTNLVKQGQGLVSKGFNTVMGAVKGISQFLPMIILAVAVGLGAVLIILLLMSRKRAPPEVMPY